MVALIGNTERGTQPRPLVGAPTVEGILLWHIQNRVTGVDLQVLEKNIFTCVLAYFIIISTFNPTHTHTHTHTHFSNSSSSNEVVIVVDVEATVELIVVVVVVVMK